MAFIGKTYELDSQENYEEFLDALEGLPDELKEALVNHKPVIKISKSEEDEDQYVLYQTLPGDKEKEITFKSGEEVEESLGSIELKSTITVEDDTVTQELEAANGATLTFKREFTEEECVVTLTTSLWDGTAKRIYKVVSE